jgi:hypothetical protein
MRFEDAGEIEVEFNVASLVLDKNKSFLFIN